jgi:hypothetical protein
MATYFIKLSNFNESLITTVTTKKIKYYSKLMVANVVISFLDPSTLFGINSSLEIAVLKLCPESQDVVFESILGLELPGLEIAIDVLSIDLIDS